MLTSFLEETCSCRACLVSIEDNLAESQTQLCLETKLDYRAWLRKVRSTKVGSSRAFSSRLPAYDCRQADPLRHIEAAGLPCVRVGSARHLLSLPGTEDGGEKADDSGM